MTNSTKKVEETLDLLYCGNARQQLKQEYV